MRILLIQDEANGSQSLIELLKTNQASILCARSDQEGIDLAFKTSPDLIIIERGSKQHTDWHICSSLRSSCAAPILILSPHNDPVQVANALDAGADHYIAKPVTSTVLMANVRNLVRRSRLAQGWVSIWQDQLSAS